MNKQHQSVSKKKIKVFLFFTIFNSVYDAGAGSE
jgi:hypothetical protein